MAKKISGTLPPYLVMIPFFRWQNRISKPGFLFEEIVMVPGEVLPNSCLNLTRLNPRHSGKD